MQDAARFKQLHIAVYYAGAPIAELQYPVDITAACVVSLRFSEIIMGHAPQSLAVVGGGEPILCANSSEPWALKAVRMYCASESLFLTAPTVLLHEGIRSL